MPIHPKARFLLPFSRWLSLFILAVPFLILVLALWFWSENVVFHDDYALLGFLLDWTDPAVSWGQKIQRLVEPHNYHRIVYDRLVTLATYYLTGRMNILIMIALGNAALLGIVWRFWTLFRQLELPGWYFIPVPYWLLNLQSHENMFWGMAALQNFTVIYLILEALHRLIRRDRIIGPLLLSIAALFTSGNGLLAVGVGSLLVAWQWRWRTDGWVWVAGIAGALVLFFWNYQSAPLAGTLLEAPPKLLMVLGASLTNQVRFGLAAAGGVLIAVGWVVALVVSYRSRRQLLASPRRTDTLAELLAIGAVVLATAAILSISRPSDELLRDRYRIYSHLAFSLSYLLGLLLIARQFRPTWAVLTGSIAVAMYSVSAYAKIPEILIGRQTRQLDAFNVRYHGTTLPLPYYAENTRKVLKRMDDRGVFRYPSVWSDPARWQPLPVTCRLTVEPYSDPNPTGFLARNNHYLRVRSTPAFLPGAFQLGSSTYLIAESASGRRYVLPALPVLDTKLTLLTTGRYFRNERLSDFQKAILTPGTYQLGLLFVRNDEVAGFTMSQQTFTVTPTD